MANEEGPAENSRRIPRFFWPLSAALFVGVVIVWMGVSGAIRLSDLQPWQPSIAAMVALIAAYVAYRGAMARVNLDRETAITDRRRKQQRILIRLEVALRHTLTVMGSEKVKDLDDVLLLKIHMTKPAEVNEAWENLDLLDEPLAILIGDLWREYDQLHTAFLLEDEIESRSFDLKGFLNVISKCGSNVRKVASECLHEVLKARRDAGRLRPTATEQNPSDLFMSRIRAVKLKRFRRKMVGTRSTAATGLSDDREGCDESSRPSASC
jgi:hypothetical protein